MSFVQRRKSSKKFVLVVEDDADCRELAEMWFKRNGHATLALSDAREAFSFLESNPHGVDLLLTDHTLVDPHETGTWLLQRAHRAGLLTRLPHVVLYSACSRALESAAMQLPNVRTFLKPVQFEAVLDLLAASSSASVARRETR